MTLSMLAAIAVQTVQATDYALLVGVSTHDETYLPTQFSEGSDTDITLSIRPMLLRSAVTGITEDSLTELVDAKARKGDPAVSPIDDPNAPEVGIRSWIAYYAMTAQPGDTFLFYYSGVGGKYSLENNEKAAFLTAFDANYSEAELVQDLAAFQPGVRVLVILDSRYAGALPPLQETSPKPTIAALTPSKTTNRAQIGWITSVNHAHVNGGSFAQRIVDAVETGAADAFPFGNGDHVVDAREVALYLRSQSPATSYMYNEALCAEFALGGDSYRFAKVEIQGTLAPTVASKEQYQCVAVYTNGIESAALVEYEIQKADFATGLIEEEPVPPVIEGLRVEIPTEDVDSWTLDPASAGTFVAGLLELTNVAPDTSLTLRASGTWDGQPWTASLEVASGDPKTSYAEALDNTVVTWTPSAWTQNRGLWFVDTNTTHDGEDALQSAPVGVGESSSFSGTFNGRGVLSFWYKVDAKFSDGLVVTVDGNELLQATGECDWTQAQSLVGPGDHEIVFTYRRLSVDSSADLGRAWVDQVSFAPATFAFDMDANNNGWTTGGFTNLWERGVPSFGPTGSDICWGTDLDGRYANTSSCWLMSPILSISSPSILTFRTWFDIDNQAWRYFFAASGSEFDQGWKGNLDGGMVQLSINGAGWINITPNLTCPGNTAVNTIAGKSAGWTVASVALPEEAIGKSVRIRFLFETDAYVDPNTAGSPAGWFIDDVAVYSTEAPELALVRTQVKDTAIGNGNGLVEPGESVWVDFEIANQGAEDLVDAKGQVRSLTPGVTLPTANAPVTYGTIAAGATAIGAPRLLVKVDPSVAPGTLVRLLQTIKDASGAPVTLESSFRVDTASTLTGFVSDPSGTNRLAGATVSLGQDRSVTTDNTGCFSFSDLPSGTYLVTPSAEGYSSTGSTLVTLPMEGDLNLVLGKAYATLSTNEVSVTIHDLEEGGTASFLISNVSGTENGTIATTYTFLFPEGQPAWLDLVETEGTILPGATREVKIKIRGEALLDEPVLSAVIRVVSNDCRSGIENEVELNITVIGISDAVDYLSIASFEGSNFPNQDGADADGYLERGENGALAFTLLNESLVQYKDLKVVNVEVVSASEGASPSDLQILDAAEPRTIASLPREGAATVFPAYEVQLQNSGVADPSFELEITLKSASDETPFKVRGTYTAYDRYSAMGVVYRVSQLGETPAAFREPVAEALVVGMGVDGYVETVTLEDGSYVLHGLRSGYNKLYAKSSAETLEYGISLPVVFADVQSDLPDAAYLSAFEMDPNSLVGFDLTTFLAEDAPAAPAEGGEEGGEPVEPAPQGLDFYLPLVLNARLEVVDYTLTDASGNGIVEPEEEFSLSFTIGNTGYGTCHGMDVEVISPLAIDGAPLPSFTPSPVVKSSVRDEEGNPLTDDLGLLPRDSISEATHEDLCTVVLTAGTETGVLPVLVKMTDYRADAETGEWIEQGVWYTTLDLTVAQVVRLSGTVGLKDENDESVTTPLASVSITLEKHDADDPSVILSTEVVSSKADGTYSFTLFDDFDALYTVRPGMVDGALILDPKTYEDLPGDTDRTDLNFTYEPHGGLVFDPAPLEITHAEGESTTASLTVENLTGKDVTIDRVMIRYSRTDADMATAKPMMAMAAGQAAADTGTASSDDGLDVPGELFVTFRPGVAVAEQDALLSNLGLTVKTRFRLIQAIHCTFDSSTKSYDALRAALLQTGLVAKVDTVRILKGSLNALASATDPLADIQWALSNYRQTGGTKGEDINVLPLWEKGLTGSRSVLVAVHDSGVDRTHPDLAANIYVNEAELNGTPGVDDDGNGYIDDVYGWNFVDDSPNTIDENGHGTHVAGILGAAANDAGTLGVNWNVSILPIRVTDKDGMLDLSSADLARSFEYMVDCGVQIANCSWGNSSLFAEPIVADAVHAACDAGILIVVAAGNEAKNCDTFPGTLYGLQNDNMIVVAAADHNGKIASFSNFGENSVHIAAPGVEVLSTHPEACLDDFLLDGGVAEDSTHVYMDGTSMAAPYVTGAAALLLASAPETPTAVIREAILHGARYDANLTGWVSTSAHLDVANAFRILGADWLVATTELPLNLASGANTTMEFDVNPELTLVSGTYKATIEIEYTVDGQKQVAMVDVTNTVSGGSRVEIVSVFVDDSEEGDYDGYAEPGESVNLFLTLRNISSGKMMNVNGSLVEGVTNAFPNLISGAAGVNVEPFADSFETEGMASRTLTLIYTIGAETMTNEIPFEIPVREAASVYGRVLDSAGNGIANAYVDFWTAESEGALSEEMNPVTAGCILTAEDGSYWIDGLAMGATVYVRAVPDGYARSDVFTVTAQDETELDLPVTSGSAWFMGIDATVGVESTLRVNGSESISFVVTNTTSDTLVVQPAVVQRKSILLVSDAEGLDPLVPELEKMGFDVQSDIYQYEFVNVNYGAHDFSNEEHFGSAYDEAYLQQFDFVLMDLAGSNGVGRQFTEQEALAIQSYIQHGGKVLFIGSNLFTRPDDVELSKLFGDASLDRIEALPATARPKLNPANAFTWSLPGVSATSFADLGTGTDNLVLPGVPFAYDVASPVMSYTPVATVSADGETADKLYCYQSGNGTLYYWGGMTDEVLWRGVWHDVLRDLLASELYTAETWATTATESWTLPAGAATECTIALDASSMEPGDYEATLLLFGKFVDAETLPVNVTLHVTRPVFTAFSNAGVTNAFGAYLKGNGQPNSYVYQLILTTDPTGNVSAPDANGLPSGGEAVISTLTSGAFYGYFGSNGGAVDLGQFTEQYELTDTGVPVYAVVRAWTGPAPGAGAFWGDSAPYAVQFTENESHNFGSWCVGNLFTVEGSLPLDSNGDGVPDAYVLEHFPGKDPAADLFFDASREGIQQVKNGSSTYFPYRVFATERYVYALDNHQKRITVWTTEGQNGTLVGYFNPTGTIRLSEPVGMGLQRGAFRFAVSDAGRHVVHVFEFDEDAIAASTIPNLAAAFQHVLTIGVADVPAGKTNALGETGLFTAPKGVAMDAEGAIYVADTGDRNGQSGRSILVFNADGSPRTTIRPTGAASLVDPSGLDIDPATGDIYVANTGAGNIVRLSATGVSLGIYTGDPMVTVVRVPQIEQVLDPNSGRSYVVTNGFHDVTTSYIAPVAPVDVKVWNVGSTFRLLVADRDGNAIHVADSNGKFIATFTNPVTSQDIYSRLGNFRQPWGVFPIDDSANAWVADTRNNRLQYLSMVLDGDKDGIDDTLEMMNGRDPTVADEMDTDGDGITDAMELLLGTDPESPDSDDDGLSDFEEINAGLDPTVADAEILKTMTVKALPEEGGTVSIEEGLTLPAGTNATLVATAAEGWVFIGWQDGVMESNRTVRVGLFGNEYIALFDHEPETPDEPTVEPPAIHAESISVEGDDLIATFSTDATELAQLYTFIDEGTSTASLIYADTLEHLAAYRADSSVTEGIGVSEVSVTIDTDTLGFSIVGEGLGTLDSLFIIGFDLP